MFFLTGGGYAALLDQPVGLVDGHLLGTPAHRHLAIKVFAIAVLPSSSSANLYVCRDITYCDAGASIRPGYLSPLK